MHDAPRTPRVFSPEYPPETGLTLISVLVASTVLAIAACGLSAALTMSMTVSQVNKETSQARMAAQQLLETMQNVPVNEVFSTFNDCPEDDPLGPGTAVGSSFLVPTKPSEDATDGLTGRIMFPGDSNAGILREDVGDERLGMPLDLNGDETIDSEDHSGDYLLLPVRIRITWSGLTGDRTYDLCSVLLND